MRGNTMPEPTIYAVFANPSQAEKAAGAVIDHGIRPENISLIVGEAAQKDREEFEHPKPGDTIPQITAKTHDPLFTPDPFNNDMRDTPVVVDPKYRRDELDPEMGAAGDELNPAQEDYPRTYPTPEGLSSAPPAAPRDYNAGLEKDGYNAAYNADVERENEREWARQGATPASPASSSRSEHFESAAKAGISTTTVEDAASGAKKGALWGLGVGALAAVAAIAIPGYGIVLGGGALAAAIGAMATGAGAGAVAGGVVGYLKDQGVPSHDIPQLEQAVRQGGALLAVHLGSEEDRARIEDVLRKYGASSTNSYGYAA
jgi:hypothetical protein